MRKALAISLVVAALFAAWVLHLLWWLESVKPGGQTLAEQLVKMPEPDQRRVFTKGGQEYLALFGPVEALPRFPSGPPVYIFDSAGRLVDWTPDEGDDEAFHQRWPGAFGGREITQIELAVWPGASR